MAQAGAVYALDPALPVLLRPDGAVQVGWGPHRAVLIRHLMEGQYSDPVRVVAFNTAAGWSRDVTEEIAREL